MKKERDLQKIVVTKYATLGFNRTIPAIGIGKAGASEIVTSIVQKAFGANNLWC